MATADPNLVKEALQGDQKAFDRLVGDYSDPLLRHCSRFLHNSQDREDALQETFLNAWQARDSFRGDCSVADWLYKIAERVCLNRLRKRENISLDSLDIENMALVGRASPEPSVEQLAQWGQMREAVVTQGQAVKPPWDERDHIIYRLHCEWEETFAEIARRLGMEETTVKHRYYRKIEPVLRQVESAFADA